MTTLCNLQENLCNAWLVIILRSLLELGAAEEHNLKQLCICLPAHHWGGNQAWRSPAGHRELRSPSSRRRPWGWSAAWRCRRWSRCSPCWQETPGNWAAGPGSEWRWSWSLAARCLRPPYQQTGTGVCGWWRWWSTCSLDPAPPPDSRPAPASHPPPGNEPASGIGWNSGSVTYQEVQ